MMFKESKTPKLASSISRRTDTWLKVLCRETLVLHFDLFISADTFIYVGNLRPSFEAVSEFSENGAVFLFSTEHVEEGDFLLRKSNRYAQSKDYVLSLADEFGFRLEHFSEAGLRKEGETWIPGGYYVLRKA